MNIKQAQEIAINGDDPSRIEEPVFGRGVWVGVEDGWITCLRTALAIFVISQLFKKVGSYLIDHVCDAILYNHI
jgi:hypothetical protein